MNGRTASGRYNETTYERGTAVAGFTIKQPTAIISLYTFHSLMNLFVIDTETLNQFSLYNGENTIKTFVGVHFYQRLIQSISKFLRRNNDKHWKITIKDNVFNNL